MHVSSIAGAEPFSCAGIEFGMILPRNVTNSCEVVLEVLEPGQETPVDQHANFDQIFILLEGAGDLKVGVSRRDVFATDVCFIPRRTEHAIRCTSAGALRYLYINVWGQGLPESECDWKQVYLAIHDRRIHESQAERGA